MLIGIISDTHGLLRPEALDALRGSKHIIHAGDVGAPEILDRLRQLAPVTAVRGNIDHDAWAEQLPETEVVELAGATVYVLHNLKQLDLDARVARFAAVISGHTHQPKIETRSGALYFNPGSAGPRRFRLPISIGRLRIGNGSIAPELITIA